MSAKPLSISFLFLAVRTWTVTAINCAASRTFASISIGTEQAVTVGFIQEWLAWHDVGKAEREHKFRSAQVFATRWAAGAATVAALAAAVGWAWTILHK
jgi:hypothetical protein